MACERRNLGGTGKEGDVDQASEGEEGSGSGSEGSEEQVDDKVEVPHDDGAGGDNLPQEEWEEAELSVQGAKRMLAQEFWSAVARESEGQLLQDVPGENLSHSMEPYEVRPCREG